MQAITTKYIGPTNARGSRVKAKAQAGNVTIGWDSGLGVMDNHKAAAEALIRKLGWDKPHYGNKWIGGGLPDGTGEVYINIGFTFPEDELILD